MFFYLLTLIQSPHGRGLVDRAGQMGLHEIHLLTGLDLVESSPVLKAETQNRDEEHCEKAEAQEAQNDPDGNAVVDWKLLYMDRNGHRTAEDKEM